MSDDDDVCCRRKKEQGTPLFIRRRGRGVTKKKAKGPVPYPADHSEAIDKLVATDILDFSLNV